MLLSARSALAACKMSFSPRNTPAFRPIADTRADAYFFRRYGLTADIGREQQTAMS
jgi:hypothetical protein